MSFNSNGTFSSTSGAGVTHTSDQPFQFCFGGTHSVTRPVRRS